MESVEYEFTDKQNELIRDLARKVGFVGILMIVGGVLGIVAGVVSLFVTAGTTTEGLNLNFSSLVQGIFLLVIGIWTRNAAIAFKRVVRTTGKDIENLMRALKELRKLYTLQYWLAIVLLVLLAVTLVITITGTIIASPGN